MGKRRESGATDDVHAVRDARAAAALADDLAIDIDAELAGRTTTEAIRLVLGRISWRAARAYVQARRVSINGAPSLDPARRLTEGERVVVHAAPLAPPPALEDLAILHLDESVVVFDKPAGIATERFAAERRWPARRKALQPVAEELLPAAIARREGVRARVQLTMVHRLDRETSGVMVAARTERAAQGLIALFARHEIHRAYEAICRGRVAAARTIRSHLVRDRGDGVRGSGDEGEGQLAVTHVEPLEAHETWSHVRCRLETGRTHQIRIHLAEAGHPLFGDKRYGRPEDAHAASERHALHAVELAFAHPETRAPMTFRSPLARDLERLLARLRAEG